MADQKVKVRVEAEDRASKTVANVEGRFKRFGNFLKARFVITLGDVVRAFRGVVSGITSTIRAAEEQETAIKKLDTALKKLGPSSASVSKELQEQAAALQKVTTAGDETIIKGQALLASFTDNVDEIKAATKAALDLSAATGQDLNSAFLLMGKAVAGETSTLSRYGIILDESTPKSEKFAAAIEKINEQFGGQAEALADTFAGVVKQIGNAFGDLQERVGDAIIKNEEVVASLKELRDVLSDPEVSDGIADLASGMTQAAGQMVVLAAKAPEAHQAILDFGRGVGSAIPGLDKLNTTLEKFVQSNLKQASEKELPAIVVAVSEWVEATTRAGAEINALAEEQANLTEETNNYNAARERSTQLDKEYADELEKVRDIAKELGVELEQDVNKQLEKNAEKLREVELAAHAGIIEWEDYERISKAMAGTSNELTESLGSVGEETERVTEKMTGLADATEQVVASQSRMVESSQLASATLGDGGGLFPGLSGKQYTYQTFTPATVEDLEYRGGATFYRGREVRVLPDGRIEWA